MSARALLFVAAMATACGSARAPMARPEPAYVQVDNRGFADVVVYSIDGGRRIRLGTVNGVTTTKLRIPNTVVGFGRDVQFLADPIGSSRTAISNQIYVRPGEVVTLVIPPG